MVAATAELSKDRTAVIVAHRPAMIELADRVIRVHEGRVVADTTRTEPALAPPGPGAASPQQEKTGDEIPTSGRVER
ncbi:hypothetical protein ACFSTC_33505 [Nonomuraea ferruginea]